MAGVVGLSWQGGSDGVRYISYTHCAIPFFPGTALAIAPTTEVGWMAKLGKME